MAEYRNTSQGARTLKLVGGGYILVEAGATVSIASHKVARIGPDIVEAAPDKKLPKPPAAAVKAVAGTPKAKRKAPASAPRARKAPAKRKA